jgi:hypothetical protein
VKIQREGMKDRTWNTGKKRKVQGGGERERRQGGRDRERERRERGEREEKRREEKRREEKRREEKRREEKRREEKRERQKCPKGIRGGKFGFKEQEGMVQTYKSLVICCSLECKFPFFFHISVKSDTDS